MQITQPIFEYQVILPHTSQLRLLLVQEAQGWLLPHWQTSTRYFWQSVQHINASMNTLFGLDVTVLRLFHDEANRELRHYLNIYELENHSPNWQPPQNARWVDRAEFATLPLSRSELQPVILSWFEEQAQGVPTQRRAWARKGWFASAVQWIERQAAQHQIKLIGPAEQLRTWERSCLLRVNSATGWLYFKAIPLWFAHELRLLDLLIPAFPQNLPQLIATDATQNWMLMHDFGGQSLDSVAEPLKWAEALRGYAAIQQYTAQFEAELLAIGCPDRSLRKIAAAIDPFFQELEVYTKNRWSSLTAAEIAQLRAIAPQLKASCQELASYNLPMTIEHGDFWPGNVVATSQSFLYYDWSDCSVSHPFFSLLLFLQPDTFPIEAVQKAFEEQGDWQNYLRQAYLHSWTQYESLERLEAACNLALKLAPLHHAMLYHYQILPNMEMRWEMESMVTFYLKMLL